MNVLIVMPLGEFGGGAEQMLYTYLTSRARPSELKLHFLFLTGGSLADEARKHGYPVIVIEAGRLRDVGRWLRVQRQIRKQMDVWNIDRVLAWMPKAGAYVAIPARQKGIPLYMWRHDIPSRLDRLDRLVVQIGRPAGIACSSGLAHQAFQGCTRGIPSRAIHPAASPMMADKERVKEIRRTILGQSDGPIIGTVARLQPWKRIDLFLSAASILKRSHPGLKVVVVGGESHGLSQGYEQEIRRMGQSLLRDSVIFAGEQRNVEDWLHAMDLFVLASSGEPFGIVLLEALSAGKPVVGCAGGGPEEIIRDGVIGRLLQRNPSSREMADAMGELLETAELRRASEINPVAVTRFSPETMAKRIDEWLAEAL